MRADLLTINLLSQAERPTATNPLEHFRRVPVVLIAIGVLAVLALSPVLVVQWRSRQLATVRATIQTLTPKRIAVEQAQRQLQRLQEQEAAFTGLSNGMGSWARRLNALSDLAPEGVWFMQLELEPGEDVVIRSAVLSDGGTEMVRVRRLIQGLREDPAWSTAVEDVQVHSIQRVEEGEAEFVQFTLTCALRGKGS